MASQGKSGLTEGMLPCRWEQGREAWERGCRAVISADLDRCRRDSRPGVILVACGSGSQRDRQPASDRRHSGTELVQIRPAIG